MDSLKTPFEVIGIAAYGMFAALVIGIVWFLLRRRARRRH
jgi:hypothetical protein